VAKSTVERLKRANGWRGVTRTRKVRTTVSDPSADRAPDLADGQFRSPPDGSSGVTSTTRTTFAPLPRSKLSHYTSDSILVKRWSLRTRRATQVAENATNLVAGGTMVTIREQPKPVRGRGRHGHGRSQRRGGPSSGRNA
jgi:hypothetical protein